MLDRTKVIKEFFNVAERLFPEDDAHLSFYQDAWTSLVNDVTFPSYIRALPETSMTPLWEGRLEETTHIEPFIKPYYSILGIDGSQVYPDRHIAGAGCFLINSGGCWIWYNESSRAELFSEPQVFLQQQVAVPGVVAAVTEDIVDLVREQYELQRAVKKSQYYANLVPHGNFLCLFDGGMIFWYLENKQEEIQHYFFNKYIESLLWFYQQRVYVAGYISFPKSRELSNLLRVRLCLSNDMYALPCYGRIANCPCAIMEDIVDTTIISWFLPPFCRTTVFTNRAKISSLYPPELKPHFFYLNVGQEIVRIEVPQWLVQTPGAVDTISAMCLDQTRKGLGYPVVLAEAHEQAVVRANDREFFFDLIRKIGIDRKKHLTYSQKSIRKRNMSI